MAKGRIGINGFGRIGRGFVRCLAAAPDTFDIVQINDLTDVGTLGHLLRHDSGQGRFPGTVEAKDGALVVNGDSVKISAQKYPAAIGWRDAGVDIVILPLSIEVYELIPHFITQVALREHKPWLSGVLAISVLLGGFTLLRYVVVYAGQLAKVIA